MKSYWLCRFIARFVLGVAVGVLGVSVYVILFMDPSLSSGMNGLLIFCGGLVVAAQLASFSAIVLMLVDLAENRQAMATQRRTQETEQV